VHVAWVATLSVPVPRVHSRARQTVIEQNRALQERDAHKLTEPAATIADAVRAGRRRSDRHVGRESGVTVFAVAFAQWIGKGEKRRLADLCTDVLRDLQTLTARTRPSRGRR
jgi:hypothetical protein